jgi:hypothetical protein
MANRIVIALFACSLLAVDAALAQPPVPAACAHDRTRVLALDETAFDQDMQGGWRPLAGKPGCELVAADLLRDYRRAHASEAGILYWHEGQLRANAGQYAQAIALLEHARKPAGVPDKAAWNPYVDATIAFLRRDRPALERAHRTLAASPPPPAGDGMPVFKDGHVELDMADGRKMKVRWPLNIDVVEGLLDCYDKPYAEAYGEACRRPVR